MKQKKFIDISRVKLGNNLSKNNTDGFVKGDLIVIQEKIDGSNSSFTYDEESDTLIAFSRKKQLNENNTLNGFYQWVQALNKEIFKKYSNYIFFGEWLTKHTVVYTPEAYKKFYFYDVYDKTEEKYLHQDKVKDLANELGLQYVNTLYVGEFISWEHCEQFMNISDIAINKPEGIVVKNQTRLNNPYSGTPFVLKLINSDFSEIKSTNHKSKVDDPEKTSAKRQAQEIVDMIITKTRVEKEIYKMKDENILPNNLCAEHMKIIAQQLPKRIYQDCLKEEKELVDVAGEYFGKYCSAATMKYARQLIVVQGE